MRETNRKIFIVCDDNGIPLASQPYYTLQEACERCTREVTECVRLFGGERKDYDRWFRVLNTRTDEYVL